jgi:hypothetical protein
VLNVDDFDQLCVAVRDDILLADSIFLPQSPALSAHQAATMVQYANGKFIFHQACRGAAKSYTTARFMLLWALTHKTKNVITAPTYRQALLVFQYIVDMIKENSNSASPISLSAEIDGKIVGGGSIEARMRFKNGSIIKALPMADGSRLRGERANTLHCDEFFKMEKAMFETHILPFLVSPIIKTRRNVLLPPPVDPKCIMTTSAEYEDCYAFHFLTNRMLPAIRNEDKIVEAKPEYKRKYYVLDWNIEDLSACGFELDPDIIEFQLGDATPEEKARGLYNKWVGISGQFFPSLVDKISSKFIKVEYEADPTFAYSFTVDVATVEGGDDFVIDVWKHLGNKKTALVHTYVNNGLSNDDMAFMIHHYNRLFKPEIIMIDKGGGGQFVQKALYKRKLILQHRDLIAQYGEEHDIQVPLVLHDEVAFLGDNKILFNKPTDPMIQAAFAGAYSRSGEYLNTEDLLSHFIFDTMKKTLLAHEPSFLIPYTASVHYDGDGEAAKAERYSGSEQAILDNIKEAVHQLRHLRIKTEENPDGSRTIVLSKQARVPSYIWRNSKKDGAVTFLYGLIPHLLHYKDERGAALGDTGLIFEDNQYDNGSAYRGMVDHLPEQIYNPFANH